MSNDVDQQIEQLIARGALFIANHSGGKDSQACLATLLKRGIPARQILVVHASLGAMEWEGALEKAQEHAQAHGLDFIVAKATKTLFEMVERRYQSRPEVPSWPSSSTRQCTSDLKRGPIEREVRHYADAHGFKVIVNCLGIRAQESPGRAKRPVFSTVTRNWTAGREWYEFLPIHDLKLEEVFAVIKESGQELHFAYGLGNERLSCVFCIMGSKNDCKVGAQHNPELLREYLELEVLTGYTMHMSRESLQKIVFGVELQPGALAA